MNKITAIAIFFSISLISVNGVQYRSLNIEDDIKEFAERKIDEICGKMLEDRETQFVLQDKMLKEYEQKLQTQNEVLKEHTRKLEIQEEMLKEHQRKLVLQGETLKTYERKLEIQNDLLVNDIQKAVDKKDKRINEFESDVANQSRTYGEYTRKEVRDKVLNDHSGNDKKRLFGRSTAEGVSFSVQLTGQQRHIGLRQTIKFDRVDLNDGNGYSVNTGIFTAPQSGVYMFSYFLAHGTETAQVWLELMVNGGRINAGVADTFHYNQDTQGGNFAILRLNAGDSVWVESWHQSDAYLDGQYGFTTFAGAFLY